MSTIRERDVAGQILAAYSLKPVSFNDRQMGYRNRSYPTLLADGRHANLILYKSDADILQRIRNANLVSNFAARRGLPARRTIDPRIARIESAARTRYAAVYDYLPGHTIPWEGYTQKHLKLLGWALGRLHAELAELARPSGLHTAVAEYRAINRRMRAYFDQPAVTRALAAKLGLRIDPSICDRFDRLLAACNRLPNQQILHLDFVRSNILFGHAGHAESPFQLGGVAVTGVLDFEKTAFGHPVFDLARTLAFLLVDCKYKPPAKIHKYFLHSGYAKRGHGTLPPARLLEPLTTLFLVYDLYKFLRHNPYESLSQNEHFARTRTQLVRRGVIAYTTTDRFAPALPLPL